MHKGKRLLHDHEVSVMQVIWEQGESTDAQVQKMLGSTEDLDRSKITKIISDLVQRGVLTQREEENTYVYTPLVSRREVEEALLRDLHDYLFQGSNIRMIRSLVEHRLISKGDLITIAREL